MGTEEFCEHIATIFIYTLFLFKQGVFGTPSVVFSTSIWYIDCIFFVYELT